LFIIKKRNIINLQKSKGGEIPETYQVKLISDNKMFLKSDKERKINAFWLLVGESCDEIY